MRQKSPLMKQKVEVVIDGEQNLDFQKIQKLCIDKMAMIITITIGCFALFVCFDRAAYIDLMIASAFVAYHHLNQLDAKKMKFMALGLALSVILDIAWLAIYNNNWWDAGVEQSTTLTQIALLTNSLADASTNSTETYNKISNLESSLWDDYDPSLVASLYKFVIVMSYFLMISKVLGSIIYFVESNKFPSGPNVVSTIGHNNKSEIKNNSSGLGGSNIGLNRSYNR